MKKPGVNPHAQAAMREVVENQLRSNEPPETQQTLKRLIDAGFTEEMAKRLIGAVVSAEIFDVLKNQEPFNRDRFVNNLNKLPAMPWDEDEK